MQNLKTDSATAAPAEVSQICHQETPIIHTFCTGCNPQNFTETTFQASKRRFTTLSVPVIDKSGSLLNQVGNVSPCPERPSRSSMTLWLQEYSQTTWSFRGAAKLLRMSRIPESGNCPSSQSSILSVTVTYPLLSLIIAPSSRLRVSTCTGPPDLLIIEQQS